MLRKVLLVFFCGGGGWVVGGLGFMFVGCMLFFCVCFCNCGRVWFLRFRVFVGFSVFGTEVFRM